jgi:hypothetical protein
MSLFAAARLRGLVPGMACLLFMCPAAPVHSGGEGKIDTDGPDFVESTESVARGRFQFEAGPQLEQERRDGALPRTVSTPLLLKAGLGDGWEARLETDGRVERAGMDEAGAPQRLRGTADTALGLKWHVLDRDPAHGVPALAWIAHVEGRSGSANLRGQGLRPSLRAVVGWDLPHDFSIGLMPGVKIDARADGHRYVSGILGAVAGKWWTGRLRTFVEIASPRAAREENGGVLLYKNAGAAYLLGDDWQIGARAGWAANRNTPTRYLLVSLAGRF